MWSTQQATSLFRTATATGPRKVNNAYVSQITPAVGLGLPATPPTTLAGQELVANAVNANAAFTRVMHPVEPVQARFSLRYTFRR